MSKNKKIMAMIPHYIPFFVGGAELTLHRNLAALVKLGYDCRAVCFLDQNAKPFIMKEIEYIDGVEVIREQSPAKSFTMEHYIQQADVVMTHSNLTPTVVRMAKKFEKKVITTVIDQNSIQDDSIFEAVKSSDFVIAPSPYISQELLLMNVESTILMPTFNSYVCDSDEDKKAILFVTPRKHKGYEIFTHLAESFPDEKFVVVGDVEENRFIRPNIRYMGRLDQDVQMDQCYCLSKVVIVPSQVPEAFCMVAAEAVYRRIPVVASDCGALPNTVGKCGILVNNYTDPKAWETALTKALKSKKTKTDYKSQVDYYKKMSDIGRLVDILESVQ